MIDLFDWRASSRYGVLYTLPSLLTGDHPRPTPDPTRFVWRWLCEHCETFYLAICHASAQPCPECGHLLARVGGVWDLQRERSPKWWS
jgi:hypothetical protein